MMHTLVYTNQFILKVIVFTQQAIALLLVLGLAGKSGANQGV